MAETKEQKKQRLFDYYVKAYNAIPDFECFMSSIDNEKDKKVFTETTFKTYFYKNFKMTKDLIKAFKEGRFKKGDIVVDSLSVTQNNIRGQRYGMRKTDEVIQPFSKDFSIKKCKRLYNKKLERYEIQDFEIDTKSGFGKKHFMVSNLYGNHIRHTECYLSQFIETASLRKTYKVEQTY